MHFPGKEKKSRRVEQILLEEYDHYYRLAFSYVHSEADAADIVQEGAYRAILHSDTLRQEEYAGTWIYRIMLNEIFRYLKKSTSPAGGAVPLEEVTEAYGEEDRYEDTDLRRALDAMPPEDKAVIELKYFEDMKLEEIAMALDENVNTVKSRLYRGLKKLKLELADPWRREG